MDSSFAMCNNPNSTIMATKHDAYLAFKQDCGRDALPKEVLEERESWLDSYEWDE